MKDVNTCSAKDCDKPRFLDYYVCVIATRTSRRHTLTSASTPNLSPASPLSRNPRPPTQHSLTPQSALEYTEPSPRCSYGWPLAGVFAFSLSWHRHSTDARSAANFL